MAKIEEIITENLPKPERKPFELLPDGWYAFTVTEGDAKQKSREHLRVSLRCDVTGPSHQGRVVFAGFNLKNPSERAQHIGEEQFGELLRSVGLARCGNTDELIGKRFMGRVKTQPAKGEFDARNEIVAFKAIEGGMPTTASSAPAATGAKPAAAKPPWAK